MMFNKKNEYDENIYDERDAKRHETWQKIKDAIMIIAVVAAITTVVWFHNNDKTTESSSVETGDAAASIDTSVEVKTSSSQSSTSGSEAALLNEIKLVLEAADEYEKAHPNMNEEEEIEYSRLIGLALDKYDKYLQFCEEAHRKESRQKVGDPDIEDLHRDFSYPTPPTEMENFSDSSTDFEA